MKSSRNYSVHNWIINNRTLTRIQDCKEAERFFSAVFFILEKRESIRDAVKTTV